MRVPGDWEPLAGKKGVKRYSSATLRSLVRDREAALDRKERAQGGILQASPACRATCLPAGQPERLPGLLLLSAC